MRITTANIFLLAVLSIVFLPTLFQQGMFMDGLIYAAVSKSVSVDFFNHFQLKMSETYFSDFHEQPPLAFYLQGLFIKLFGDSFFVDRLYSYCCFLVSALLLVSIAKKFTTLKNNAWLALVFFICVPVVSWSFKNNMLENTMCMFCLASVYVSLNYYTNKAYSFWIFCSINSVLILGAFLTKGFTGLFVLSFPFFYQILIKKNKTKWIGETIIMIFSILVIAIVICTISPSFFAYMNGYINSQVLASIKGTREVDGHFFIVKKMAQELAIVFIVTILLHLYHGKKIVAILQKKLQQDYLKLFFFLGLAGSLPIMISPKQSGYYVLSSYPFFALFFALLNKEEVFKLLSKINSETREKYLRKALFLIVFFAMVFSVINMKTFNRDEEKITMIDDVASITNYTSTILISNELVIDYSLYAYFARRHGVSLKTNPNDTIYYLLSKNKPNNKVVIKSYSVNSEIFYLEKK